MYISAYIEIIDMESYATIDLVMKTEQIQHLLLLLNVRNPPPDAKQANAAGSTVVAAVALSS
jgi:hypothetical protein